MAMNRQLGCATLFLTLSTAETHPGRRIRTSYTLANDRIRCRIRPFTCYIRSVYDRILAYHLAQYYDRITPWPYTEKHGVKRIPYTERFSSWTIVYGRIWQYIDVVDNIFTASLIHIILYLHYMHCGKNTYTIHYIPCFLPCSHPSYTYNLLSPQDLVQYMGRKALTTLPTQIMW